MRKYMDTSAKKAILALITGVVVMVIIDYVSAKITNSLYALPFSVLVGAIVAGILIVKRAWLIGLLVGVINSAITVVVYSTLGPSEINLFKALAYPILSFLFAGLLGGLLGGVIGAKFSVNNQANT